MATDPEDMQAMEDNLQGCPGASSAQINWGNEALRCRDGESASLPPSGLPWEGMLGAVCARLSQWKWIISKESYCVRVLVVYVSVASAFWRVAGLASPMALKGIRSRMVDFWSSLNWLKASSL